MKNNTHCFYIMIFISAMFISGCSNQSGSAQKIEPAHVEHMDGSALSRLTLTAKAIERLDIQTTQVIEMSSARLSGLNVSAATMRGARKVVPYSAIIYDAHGQTWVYTSPSNGKFMRQAITVAHIEDDMAILTDGPALGTDVVTVGAAELFGTEYEVGH